MDANLNFLTPPASKPTSVGASTGSAGLDPSLAKPMNGQEFAGVMRDLMAKETGKTLPERPQVKPQMPTQRPFKRSI